MVNVKKWLAQHLLGWLKAVAGAAPLGVLVLVRPHPSPAEWAIAAVLCPIWWVALMVRRGSADILRLAWDELKPKWAHEFAQFTEHRKSLLLTRGYRRSFEGTYRARVQELRSRPELPRMLSVGFEGLTLDDVFIDIDLLEGPFGPMANGMVGNQLGQDASGAPIWSYLDRAGPVRLVILGAPGSGKTALLNHVASTLARKRRTRRRELPIMLRLRDCHDQIMNEPDATLPDVIAASIEQKPPPPGWFEHKLADGRCVIMLDALDDVVRSEDRTRVIQWLHQQIMIYPDNDYLLTSRPYGYHNERQRLRGASALQLTGFTREQSATFVRKWYAAATLIDKGKIPDKADDLVRRIESSPALAELAANPLLLTMMIDVDHAKGKLPKTRSALYEQMFEVLLRRRLPGGNSADLPDERRAVLQGLAFEMMERQTTVLARGDVHQWILIADGGTPGSVDPRMVLADVEKTGLLVGEGRRGKYRFDLRVLQEYLAAVQIAETGREQVLLDNVEDVWWRETTLLYVAHAGAEAIVAACLESGSARALALALECAEADEDLGVDVRERLLERLGDATDPGAPRERRESAAGAIAAHELGEEFVLADGTRVCRVPVVRHLFEIMKYQAGQQPAGPASSRWADDTRGPAVGVTAAEATGLIAWLNRIKVTGGEYRLPTRKDTDDRRFPANQAVSGYSVWLAPEEGCQELGLWSGPGAPHPYAVTVGYVHERAKEDAEQLAWALTTTLAFGVAHALAVADGLARVARPPANQQPTPKQVHAKFEAARRFLDLLRRNTAYGQTVPFDSRLEHANESDFALKIGGTAKNARKLTYFRACRLARDLRFVTQELDISPQGIDLPRQAGQRRDLEGADYAALSCVLDNDIGVIAVNDELELALCIQLAGNGQVSSGRRHVLDLVWGPDLDQVMARRPERAVLPDVLRRLAAQWREEIEEMAKEPSAAPFRKIAATVARRIDEFVSQADETDDQLPRWRVSRARLGALAIAAGLCRIDGKSGLVDRCIDIAAGITALERRATGIVAPSEVVVLVRV